MEHTTAVLTGRVGSDIVMNLDQQGTTPFARFRLVVPRGRWKDDGEWEEQDGAWYTVKTWGNLAHNVHHSLRRGNPVIVVGRPAAQAWLTKENSIASEIAIHASAVGHDLSRGVSTYARISRDTDAPTVSGNGQAATPSEEDESGAEGEETPAAPAVDTDYETATVSVYESVPVG